MYSHAPLPPNAFRQPSPMHVSPQPAYNNNNNNDFFLMNSFNTNNQQYTQNYNLNFLLENAQPSLVHSTDNNINHNSNSKDIPINTAMNGLAQLIPNSRIQKLNYDLTVPTSSIPSSELYQQQNQQNQQQVILQQINMQPLFNAKPTFPLHAAESQSILQMRPLNGTMCRLQRKSPKLLPQQLILDQPSLNEQQQQQIPQVKVENIDQKITPQFAMDVEDQVLTLTPTFNAQEAPHSSGSTTTLCQPFDQQAASPFYSSLPQLNLNNNNPTHPVLKPIQQREYLDENIVQKKQLEHHQQKKQQITQMQLRQQLSFEQQQQQICVTKQEDIEETQSQQITQSHCIVDQLNKLQKSHKFSQPSIDYRFSECVSESTRIVVKHEQNSSKVQQFQPCQSQAGFKQLSCSTSCSNPTKIFSLTSGQFTSSYEYQLSQHISDLSNFKIQSQQQLSQYLQQSEFQEKSNATGAVMTSNLLSNLSRIMDVQRQGNRFDERRFNKLENELKEMLDRLEMPSDAMLLIFHLAFKMIKVINNSKTFFLNKSFESITAAVLLHASECVGYPITVHALNSIFKFKERCLNKIYKKLLEELKEFHAGNPQQAQMQRPEVVIKRIAKDLDVDTSRILAASDFLFNNMSVKGFVKGIQVEVLASAIVFTAAHLNENNLEIQFIENKLGINAFAIQSIVNFILENKETLINNPSLFKKLKQ